MICLFCVATLLHSSLLVNGYMSFLQCVDNKREFQNIVLKPFLVVHSKKNIYPFTSPCTALIALCLFSAVKTALQISCLVCNLVAAGGSEDLRMPTIRIFQKDPVHCLLNCAPINIIMMDLVEGKQMVPKCVARFADLSNILVQNTHTPMVGRKRMKLHWITIIIVTYQTQNITFFQKRNIQKKLLIKNNTSSPLPPAIINHPSFAPPRLGTTA